MALRVCTGSEPDEEGAQQSQAYGARATVLAEKIANHTLGASCSGGFVLMGRFLIKRIPGVSRCLGNDLQRQIMDSRFALSAAVILTCRRVLRPPKEGCFLPLAAHLTRIGSLLKA